MCACVKRCLYIHIYTYMECAASINLRRFCHRDYKSAQFLIHSLMEAFDLKLVAKIPHLSRANILRLFRAESERLELTTSLLNLLHNIVRVGSVPVTATQKSYFNAHSKLVLKLLNRKVPIDWKKKELEKNISLVINIAASCPTVAGS